MKGRGQFLLAGLVFVGGLALLFGFQAYIKPQLFSKEVVQVTDALARNATVTVKDVSLVRVDSAAIPEHAITDVDQVIGKKTNVELSVGMMLTRELVDVEGLQPDASEGYFPIPKTVIYAVNGSLRARDEVDIYLMHTASSLSSGKDRQTPDAPAGEPLIKRVKVVAVRSEAGNMVMDTDRGNTNGRVTSTDRISNVEVKITNDQGATLKRWMEAGYLLWIVRVT
jgi:hypothetical protein